MTYAKRLVLGKYKNVFGYRDFWLDADGIAAHKHIIGKSGKGKSKLVAQVIVGLYEMGQTFALLDPHSELASDVMALLYERGHFGHGELNPRIVYIPFWRPDRFLPFNVLNQPYPPHAIAEQMVEISKRTWRSLADGQAPTFENILRYSTLALIYNSLPLNRMFDLLTDQTFRESLLERVPDPQVGRFFHNRYDQWRKADAVLMRESTLNRIDLFTFSPTMRFSLGQQRNELQFKRFLEKGISVIYDFGRLPEQTQAFLGSFIMYGYETAAKNRTGLTWKNMCQVFADEAFSFMPADAKSFTTMLSQTRKMGLPLNIIHQDWSQADPSMRGGLSNCDVNIAFALEFDDAFITNRILGRVDPKSHRVGDHHESESIGITEQEREQIQEIIDLHKGVAYIRKPIPYYIWPLQHLAKIAPLRWFLAKWWHRHPSRLYKVKTAHYPPLKTPKEDVEALKNLYAEHYMTPAAEVIGMMEQEQTIFTSIAPKRF